MNSSQELKRMLAQAKTKWIAMSQLERIGFVWQLGLEIAAFIWLFTGFSFEPITPVYQWY